MDQIDPKCAERMFFDIWARVDVFRLRAENGIDMERRTQRFDG